MNFDLRLPLGVLFLIFGLILAGYGMLSGPEIYQRSLGVNVNLWWGLFLLLFGGVMLSLALFGKKR
jgi:hypothetical protein